MKLVIDIPEKDWEFIKEADGCRWSRKILDGVINGTPLPKGHGDLIDSNILCEQYEKTYGDLYQALDLTPIIIKADKGE